MEERRKKCSGGPERKKGGFPYRPKGAPRPAPLEDVPAPDDPRFTTIRPSFMQRKDEAALARLEHLEAHRRQVEAITDTKMRRALEREEAERQRGIDEFWHTLDRKIRPERRPDQGGQGHDLAVQGPIARTRPPFQLVRYKGPVIDRRGRVGVFLSSTYLAAKTTEYGCMKRLAYYVTKPDHLENEGSFFSKMGDDRHEIACGMGLVEDANRAARANAKVAVTFIVQLPYDVTPAERMTILRLWCEEKFGVHDMPFVAAVHKPSPDGDQRNFHGHVVTSFRPAHRTGRYAWRIGRAPRTDLDNPAMFEEYRRDFATIMTAVVQIAGKDRIYTHLSHAGRGLKHKPTEKLGPHKTRAVRSGEYVAADARNANTIAANEALVEIERIDERTRRNRRRIARLATLKAMAARSLSTVVVISRRDHANPGRKITPSVLPASAKMTPAMTSSLLAAAARAVDALRVPDIFASGEDAPLLTEAPSLQDARFLGGDVRLSTITVPGDSIPFTLRLPSMSVAKPDAQAVQPRRLPSAAAADADVAVVRLPSGRIDRDRIVRVAHRTSAVAPIAADHGVVRSPSIVVAPATTRGTVQLPSPASTIERGAVPPSQLSPVSSVEQLRVRCLAPTKICVADPEQRREVRHLTPSLVVEHAGGALVSTISCLLPVKPAVKVEGASPRHVRPAEIQPVDVVGISPRNDPRIARLDQLATAAESAVQAPTGHQAVQNAGDDWQRQHRRYVRFLALVALHPDWLVDGPQGIEIASHVPPEVRATYATWRNDHARQQIVAQVRQANLDGLHRLPSNLAREIEGAIATIVPRLPAAPPLRDASGRVSPAGEMMMAMAADTSRRMPGWRAPAPLPNGAPPALRWLFSRHRDDRALPTLLVAAQRHGKNEIGAVEIGLARRIDQRRADFTLRRARGALPVLTSAGDRLSPAMVDHLAQIRLHPEWVRRDPHLGLGLGEAAAPMFGQQWGQWSDPQLARQLLTDDTGPAAHHHLLTPAMRAQVTARVQAIAGTGGNADAGLGKAVGPSRE